MADNHEALPGLPERDIVGAFERIEQHLEIPSMIRRVSRKMLNAVSVESFRFNPERYNAIYDNADGNTLTNEDVDKAVHDYNPRALAQLNSLSLRSVILIPGENRVEYDGITYTLRGNLERADLPEDGSVLQLPKMEVELFGYRRSEDRSPRKLWRISNWVKFSTTEGTDSLVIPGIPDPRVDQMLDVEFIVDSVIRASK